MSGIRTTLAAIGVITLTLAGMTTGLILATQGPALAVPGGGGVTYTEQLTTTPSVVAPGAPVTVALILIDRNTHEVVGDVTAQTTFAFAPTDAGSCVGAVCTPATTGTLTIVGRLADGSSAQSTVTSVAPDHLVVDPVYATATAGQAIAYTVQGATADGTKLGDLTSQATITLGGTACPNAVCTARTVGEQILTVTLGDLTAGGAVMVAPGPAASLVVTPHVGNSWNNLQPATFTVESYDAFGNDLGDVTANSLFTIEPDGFCNGNTCYPASGGPHAVFATDLPLTGRADLNAATPSPHVAPALPAGTVGTSYSQSVLTSADPTAQTSLASGAVPPPGLTLGSNGILSGIPTSAGTYTFYVQAWNGSGGENMPTTITIAPGTSSKPRVSIGNASVREGNSGRTAVQVTVTLSAPTSTPVTVAWHTANGTGLAGQDYVGAHGSVTIPAGQLTGQLTVYVIDDRKVEPDERFRIVLTNPHGATLGTARATVTIANDD